MRLLLLTTETLHHAHYAREVARYGAEMLVLCETKCLSPRYDTAHPFEEERDAWEREHWFGGRHASLADFAPVERFASLNQDDAVSRMRAFAADAILTFGTSKLGPAIVAAGGERLFNLHGGNPESYRGLDTHLWAVWHGDYPALQTCLHRVASGLDEGDIVAVLPVSLWQGMDLHQLRQSNTETCLRLTRLALEQLATEGRVTSFRQRTKGRYYSFMPATLKAVCVERFRQHTGSL